MNIDEFKRKVSRCVELVEENSLIFLCPKGDEDPDDAFLVIDPYSANLSLDFEDVFIEDVPFDRFVTVLEIVKELRCTPVEERFPEKKYRLRWFDDDAGESFLGLYRKTIGRYDPYWFVSGEPNPDAVFTESELNQLKKDNPRLAPAIDAMKEEVKNDE